MTVIKRKILNQVSPEVIKINFNKEITRIHFQTKQYQLFFSTLNLIKSILSIKNIEPEKIKASMNIKSELILIKYEKDKTHVINPLGSNNFLTPKQLKSL